MNKSQQVMKADALSILGDPALVAELEEDQRRRLKKKGKDGMVLKAEKGIEVSMEVGYRPYGGATSISEALEYIANLETAEDLRREIEHSLSIWDGVVENILADEKIKDKKAALRAVISELKESLEEDVEVSKSDFYLNPQVLTLKGALKDFRRRYPNYIPPKGMLLRKVSRNILESTMVRDKGRAIDTLVKEAQAVALAEGLVEKSTKYRATKGTLSAREAANLGSGLTRDGKPIVVQRSKGEMDKEFVAKSIQSVVEAIERTRPQIIKKARVKKGSVKWYSMVNSGLDPETGKPIF